MPYLLLKLVFHKVEDRADAVLREADREEDRGQGRAPTSSIRT